MANQADHPSSGCRPLVLWLCVALLALGVVPFIRTEGGGYGLFLLGWIAIVAASSVAASLGVAAAIDRIGLPGSGRRREVAIALGTLAIGGAVLWSIWMLLGPPAEGTLNEALPLIVDPILAATVVIAVHARSERAPALAFLAAAGVVVALMVRFVAVVGPTYSR
jgi:hypothetical protein